MLCMFNYTYRLYWFHTKSTRRDMSQEISEHKVKQNIILDSKVAELDVTGKYLLSDLLSQRLPFGTSGFYAHRQLCVYGISRLQTWVHLNSHGLVFLCYKQEHGAPGRQGTCLRSQMAGLQPQSRSPISTLGVTLVFPDGRLGLPENWGLVLLTGSQADWGLSRGCITAFGNLCRVQWELSSCPLPFASSHPSSMLVLFLLRRWCSMKETGHRKSPVSPLSMYLRSLGSLESAWQPPPPPATGGWRWQCRALCLTDLKRNTFPGMRVGTTCRVQSKDTEWDYSCPSSLSLPTSPRQPQPPQHAFSSSDLFLK